MAMSTPLHRLQEHGQSVWIDFLSRELLGGELARMMREDAVSGVTSNPTIFQKAISAGDAYDEQLRDLVETEDDLKAIFIQLAAKDVGDACDLLRSVWDEGCRGCDGYVSIEVDPNLAPDTDASIAEAQRLHELIDRPNLYVKIPATKAGLPAIEEMIARGKSINVTLIFSLQRYAEVAEAYIRGLERLIEAGGDAGSVASVASFFVSRVDTEADRRLDELGGHDDLKGKLAVANAKLAYQRYKEIFAGERWEALAAKGAWRQRCLWASTSTKDPDYSDVMYVEELIGAETVNTMPEETIRAFQDHGTVAPTLESGVDEAKRVIEQLGQVGVDYDDVTATLEREGVQKFTDSFEELLNAIEAKRREVVTRRSGTARPPQDAPRNALVRRFAPPWRRLRRAHRRVWRRVRARARSAPRG
jgi:transaldolase